MFGGADPKIVNWCPLNEIRQSFFNPKLKVVIFLPWPHGPKIIGFNEGRRVQST